MALTLAADAEVFLNINVHNNNIFFVFLNFVWPVHLQSKQFAWLQAAEKPSYLPLERVLGH